MKKILALVLAAVMMMAIASVASAAATEVTTPAGTITITGLEDGDVVTLYKVIGWYTETDDTTHTTTNNWQVKAPFTSVSTDVAGYYVEMNGAKAGALANVASSANSVGSGSAGSDGTFTSASLPVGMYLAIVQTQSDEGTGTYVYNPMILSINFNAKNSSEAVSPDMAATSEFVEGHAKKTPVTLDKENNTSDNAFTATTGTAGEAAATVAEGVGVGSVLPYTVTATVPNYTAAYVNPTFQIKDQLSTGLKLDQDSITVTTADGTALSSSYYTISSKTDSGYTIDFTSEYLHLVKGDQKVVIEYKATVTTDAIYNVNRENNTVTLKYSNNASSEGSFDTTSDETNHYTFSLDAQIKGNISGHSVTSELIKTGHDGNGEPLFKWNVESSDVWTSETKLPGAKFKIWGKLNGVDWSSEITSGPNGELVIKGLDEGTYSLKEIQAPDGYIGDPNTHIIKITGEYEPKTNGSGKTFNVLTGYTVTVDGNATQYTVINEGQHEVKTSEIKKGETTAIVNTKGLELPSTGGIGTTLFYAIGGLMVLAAGIVLVSRRKADEE